jgi:hypothetical protein
VHRFVLAAHVRHWMGVARQASYRRLAGLAEVGLLSYRRIFHAQPGCYLITNGGLAVIDSALPRPAIDLRTYDHDVGVVWLWLLACEGRYGPARRVVTERQMRSKDQRNDPLRSERFGIPIGGYDRSGRPRVHYPDVLVLDGNDRRVALELELSLKSRRRLLDILIGYGGEPRLRKVVYVPGRRSVERTLQGIVGELGLGELIEVRPAAGACQALGIAPAEMGG